MQIRRFVNDRFGFRNRRLAARKAPPLAREWPTLRRPREGESLLLFAGDTHFEGGLKSLLDRHGEQMLESLKPLFAQADATFLNLETPIASNAAEAGAKEFLFRAPPTALAALRCAGVDVVSMANNHTLDCGEAGLRESLSAAGESPLLVAGIGADADGAFKPAALSAGGQRIACIAATQVLDRDWMWREWPATDARGGVASARDVDRLVASIRDARAEADTVVVFLHWGEVGQPKACPAQRDLTPHLIAAGADIIVGASSHRVNSAGMSGDRLVCYGLGNFIWWRDGAAAVLAVWVAGRQVREFQWVPAFRVRGIPQPLADGAAYVRYVQRNVARDGLTVPRPR